MESCYATFFNSPGPLGKFKSSHQRVNRKESKANCLKEGKSFENASEKVCRTWDKVYHNIDALQ